MAAPSSAEQQLAELRAQLAARDDALAARDALLGDRSYPSSSDKPMAPQGAACPACTFIQTAPGSPRCEVCGSPLATAPPTAPPAAMPRAAPYYAPAAAPQFNPTLEVAPKLRGSGLQWSASKRVWLLGMVTAIVAFTVAVSTPYLVIGMVQVMNTGMSATLTLSVWGSKLVDSTGSSTANSDGWIWGYTGTPGYVLILDIILASLLLVLGIRPFGAVPRLREWRIIRGLCVLLVSGISASVLMYMSAPSWMVGSLVGSSGNNNITWVVTSLTTGPATPSAVVAVVGIGVALVLQCAYVCCGAGRLSPAPSEPGLNDAVMAGAASGPLWDSTALALGPWQPASYGDVERGDGRRVGSSVPDGRRAANPAPGGSAQGDLRASLLS